MSTDDHDDPNPATTGPATGDRTRVLDAREVDGPPFDAIMTALADLDSDERLVLLNGFEPAPLYDVLERRGFAFETERVVADEWRVTIEHA